MSRTKVTEPQHADGDLVKVARAEDEAEAEHHGQEVPQWTKQPHEP
jgi:hypothetical protein